MKILDYVPNENLNRLQAHFGKSDAGTEFKFKYLNKPM